MESAVGDAEPPAKASALPSADSAEFTDFTDSVASVAPVRSSACRVAGSPCGAAWLSLPAWLWPASSPGWSSVSGSATCWRRSFTFPPGSSCCSSSCFRRSRRPPSSEWCSRGKSRSSWAGLPRRKGRCRSPSFWLLPASGQFSATRSDTSSGASGASRSFGRFPIACWMRTSCSPAGCTCGEWAPRESSSAAGRPHWTSPRSGPRWNGPHALSAFPDRQHHWWRRLGGHRVCRRVPRGKQLQKGRISARERLVRAARPHRPRAAGMAPSPPSPRASGSICRSGSGDLRRLSSEGLCVRAVENRDVRCRSRASVKVPKMVDCGPCATSRQR